MNYLINKISDQETTISGWIISFTGILFVRFILESLSSPTRNLQIPSNSETLVHYGLFWLTITIGLSIILGHFISNYKLSIKLALFSLPIIWLAPIFDILISRGRGYYESYILDTGKQLIYDLLTFYGPNLNWGATYGIRIEIFIVLFLITIYLINLRVNYTKIILCILSIYTFGFIVASWPGILYTITHSNQGYVELKQIYKYFLEITTNSTILHNTLYEGASSISLSRFFEVSFDKFASQVLFIVSIVLSSILFWKIDKHKFKAVISNIRLERVGSYLSLLFCGMGYAYINKLGLPFTVVDFIGVTCIALSWISLWMYAVHNNDIADIKIDEISNRERPLIQKTLDQETMKETGYIWLAIALLGSFCAGFYQFYFALVYLFCSHIYSNPPLRLRQYPLIPSFIIGVASLATVLAGFFFISTNKHILSFPILLSVGIVVMAALAINVKDIKDIEGDRKNNILTLPVIFGEYGTQIVAICFSLSFILVPFFLSANFLYLICIPFSILGYKLVTKKPFREEPIFMLRFIFLFLVAITYGGALVFLM